MSNEGFDPCEIVWGQWNHELSMRRLLNVLRNTQSYCTDNECLDDGTGGPSGASNPDQFLFLTLALITALFLYYFRPRLQTNEGSSKPNNNGNNSGGSPPSPPSSSE